MEIGTENSRVGMRIFIPLFVVAGTLFMTGETLGAFNKSKVSISLQVQAEKSDDRGEDEVETENSLTVTTFQNETGIYTVRVAMRNKGDQELKGELVWGFISDYSSGKSRQGDRYSPAEAVPALFSPGKKEIELPAGATVKDTIISEPFVFEEKMVEVERFTGKGNTQPIESETGNVYRGCLVLFVVDGEVVAKKSNSSRYEKDEWIERCLNPPNEQAKASGAKNKKKKKIRSN